MASQRGLWGTGFAIGDFPAYPCPKCDRGNLVLVENSLASRESSWATHERNEIGLDPSEAGNWYFSAFMQCADRQCGQVVTVSGDLGFVEVSMGLDHQEFRERIYPRSFLPAPPLVTIPGDTPIEVADELKIAFALFWVDYGSCANRLRISVERLLDTFEIASGTLSRRVAEFKKSDPEHADTCDALRLIGNVGSHEGSVSKEAVLDAFEVYQDALAQLFGRRK